MKSTSEFRAKRETTLIASEVETNKGIVRPRPPLRSSPRAMDRSHKSALVRYVEAQSRGGAEEGLLRHASARRTEGSGKLMMRKGGKVEPLGSARQARSSSSKLQVGGSSRSVRAGGSKRSAGFKSGDLRGGSSRRPEKRISSTDREREREGEGTSRGDITQFLLVHLQAWELRSNEVEVSKVCLGKGRVWGKAYEATMRRQLVVANVVMEKGGRERFCRSVYLYSKIVHPSIRSMKGFITDGGSMIQILEHAKGGRTLRTCLHDGKLLLSLGNGLLDASCNVLEALMYMHGRLRVTQRYRKGVGPRFFSLHGYESDSV